MNTDFERLSTAERLLTREQVDDLDSLEDLQAIQDAVMEAAKQIEVDLEFRSDDGADEGWEHRARRALAAHYVCNGHLTRRIAFLRRGGKPPKASDGEAKLRKITAHAQLLEAQAESRRAKAADEREKTVRQIVQFSARQSLLLHFHKVASEHLDKPTMARLMSMAHNSLNASLLDSLPAQGIAAAEADETAQQAQP